MREKHLKRTKEEEFELMNGLAKDLHYDPHSGYFWWTKRMSRSVQSGSIGGSISDNGPRQGYRTFAYKNKKIRAHRLAWFMFYGDVPESCVDHINGDRQDNRISNLRLATNEQNQKNRKNNNCGKTWGTQFHKNMKYKKYSAGFRINGKHKSLGYYATREEAHDVSVKYAKENGIKLLEGVSK